eukprot:2665882-Alexandrium_andersonii.AAC.1
MPLGTLRTRCNCRSRPPASPPDYARVDAATCTNAAPTFCWACTLSASRSGAPEAIHSSNMASSLSRPAELSSISTPSSLFARDA